MKVFFRAGVLTRFLWVVIPLYILLFVGFNSFFKSRIEANASEMLFHKAFTLTNTIALLVAQPLGEKQLTTVPVVLSTLVADSDIEAVRIESLSGDMVYSYGSFDKVNPALICEEQVSYANQNGIQTVGKVRLALNRDRIERWIQITMNALVLSGLLLIVLLIAVIVVAYRLSAGRQLQGLIRSIRHYQTTGEHQDVPASADDQLGEVIRAYNAMQTEAAADRRELERHSERLEESVDIRTKAYADEIERHRLTASKLSELMDSEDTGSHPSEP